jgi:2-amino-4-hydroxy-6-hydroxymethyldihydropteridine diphosphokinase
MGKKARHLYAIALGSNRARSARLMPRRMVEKAMERLSREPFRAVAHSRIIETAPLGPSLRRYSNAAMLIETRLDPEEMLAKLHRMERKAGRHRRCRAWSARPLDLDIVLWSGGMWSSDELVIPHPAFRERAFVLKPLASIARDWRDPVSNLGMIHLLARLKKPRVSASSG